MAAATPGPAGVNFVTACIFEWGIAMYDARPRRVDPRQEGDASRRPSDASATPCARAASRRPRTTSSTRHCPGRGFRRTLAANAIANLIRNVWSHSVIMCGHFPEGVETFELESLDENETRGEWYLRQMLGSADISGSPFMHLMTGNLSHQIEHHLFPDLPSNRYDEIAPRVEDLFQRYGLSYNARPLVRQVGSAWHRVVRLSLPNGWLAETNRHNFGRQLVELGRMVRHGEPQPA